MTRVVEHLLLSGRKFFSSVGAHEIPHDISDLAQVSRLQLVQILSAAFVPVRLHRRRIFAENFQDILKLCLIDDRTHADLIRIFHGHHYLHVTV